MFKIILFMRMMKRMIMLRKMRWRMMMLRMIMSRGGKMMMLRKRTDPKSATHTLCKPVQSKIHTKNPST